MARKIETLTPELAKQIIFASFDKLYSAGYSGGFKTSGKVFLTKDGALCRTRLTLQSPVRLTHEEAFAHTDFAEEFKQCVLGLEQLAFDWGQQQNPGGKSSNIKPNISR